MATTLRERPGMVIPNDEDTKLATNASRILATARDGGLTVRLEDGRELPLPKSLSSLLAHILTEMSFGNAVTLMPVHAELTTQEAAEYLNVSRPFLIKLLEGGKIEFHKVGSHRRVKLHNLIAYRAEHERRRDAAMEELAKQAQDLNLGY